MAYIEVGVLMLLGCAVILYRIWSHLLEMTSTGNTTILITTHYIEEARQAHMVSGICDLYLGNILVLM